MSDHQRFIINFVAGLVTAMALLEVGGRVLHWSDWVVLPVAALGTFAAVYLMGRLVLKRLADRPPKPHDAKGQATLLKLGHMGIVVAIVFGTISIGIDTAMVAMNHAYPTAIGWMITPVFLMFYYLLARHDTRLCESCVGSLPLNAEQQSQGWRRMFLKYWHAGRYVPLLALGVSLTALIFLHTKSATSITSLPVDVAVVAMWLSELHHRRLQPWCPWCRGGGGHSETVPEPTPPSVKV